MCNRPSHWGAIQLWAKGHISSMEIHSLISVQLILAFVFWDKLLLEVQASLELMHPAIPHPWQMCTIMASFMMVCICISLVTREAKWVSACSLVIGVSRAHLWRKFLFKVFPQFLIGQFVSQFCFFFGGVVFCLSSYKNSLYIWDIKPLSKFISF